MARSPLSAEIDPAQWAKFRRDLRRMAPEVDKALNRKLRAFIRNEVIPTARSLAGWSSRIPRSIKPTVTRRRVGLRASSRQAPHARPYEGISQGSTFRHPVFGNRDVWVTQSARPFLTPAAEQHADEFVEAAKKAVDEAARQTGWR